MPNNGETLVTTSKGYIKKNSYGFDKSFYVFVMIKVVNYD
jgi:endo-1,4-beta-D-glucanase Y